MKLSFLLIPIVAVSLLAGCKKSSTTPGSGAAGGGSGSNTPPTGTKTVSTTNTNWNWGGAEPFSAVINGQVVLGTNGTTYMVDSGGTTGVWLYTESDISNPARMSIFMPLSVSNMKKDQEIPIDIRDNCHAICIVGPDSETLVVGYTSIGGSGRIKVIDVTSNYLECKFYFVAKSGVKNQIPVVLKEGYFKVERKNFNPNPNP
jgi:hypothetical protein